MPQRTPEGKWVLYDRATGQRFDRWPVDARGLLETGAYTDEAPAGTEDIAVAPPADPMPHATVAASVLGAMSPTGAPLVIAPQSGVSAAAPLQLPDLSANRRRK